MCRSHGAAQNRGAATVPGAWFSRAGSAAPPRQELRQRPPSQPAQHHRGTDAPPATPPVARRALLDVVVRRGEVDDPASTAPHRHAAPERGPGSTRARAAGHIVDRRRIWRLPLPRGNRHQHRVDPEAHRRAERPARAERALSSDAPRAISGTSVSATRPLSHASREPRAVEEWTAKRPRRSTHQRAVSSARGPRATGRPTAPRPRDPIGPAREGSPRGGGDGRRRLRRSERVESSTAVATASSRGAPKRWPPGGERASTVVSHDAGRRHSRRSQSEAARRDAADGDTRSARRVGHSIARRSGRAGLGERRPRRGATDRARRAVGAERSPWRTLRGAQVTRPSVRDGTGSSSASEPVEGVGGGAGAATVRPDAAGCARPTRARASANPRTEREWP